MEDEIFQFDREGDGFKMIQVYCILVFYFAIYYISSTSDHQALDPEAGDPELKSAAQLMSQAMFSNHCTEIKFEEHELWKCVCVCVGKV